MRKLLLLSLPPALVFALIWSASTLRQASAQTTAPTWEYLFVTYASNTGAAAVSVTDSAESKRLTDLVAKVNPTPPDPTKAIPAILDTVGAEGWELATADNIGGLAYIWIFKRPKQ